MGGEGKRGVGPVPFARCPPGADCLSCAVGGGAVVYGPFPSRRRGPSLGVNAFPRAKVCSFDCVYCFRGPTLVKTLEPVESDYGVTPGLLERALEKALEALLEEGVRVRAVDFSGSGEPTLHPRFAELVETARRVIGRAGADVSLGVFTNSSTLVREGVLRALSEVDHVEAKLDTAEEGKLKAINRPAAGVTAGHLLRGLRSLRRLRKGGLVVQVMLVWYRGLTNAMAEDALALSEALSAVEPDEVHVYTVYRRPWSEGVSAVGREAADSFARLLRESGLRVEVFHA